MAAERAGHSIERRRGQDGAVVELLRDRHGTLLAIALPVWDPVTKSVVRRVHRLDRSGKMKTEAPQVPLLRLRGRRQRGHLACLHARKKCLHFINLLSWALCYVRVLADCITVALTEAPPQVQSDVHSPCCFSALEVCRCSSAR